MPNTRIPRVEQVRTSVRSGWMRTVAFVVSHGRRPGAAARAWGIALRGGGAKHADPRHRAHRSSQPADPRGGLSEIVKQSFSESDDQGEYVSLADLLDEDARAWQHQR